MGSQNGFANHGHMSCNSGQFHGAPARRATTSGHMSCGAIAWPQTSSPTKGSGEKNIFLHAKRPLGSQAFHVWNYSANKHGGGCIDPVLSKTTVLSERGFTPPVQPCPTGRIRALGCEQVTQQKKEQEPWLTALPSPLAMGQNPNRLAPSEHPIQSPLK